MFSGQKATDCMCFPKSAWRPTLGLFLYHNISASWVCSASFLENCWNYFKYIFLGATQSLNFLGMKEGKKVFSVFPKTGLYHPLPCERLWVWSAAGQAGGAQPTRRPAAFARGGRRQQAPAFRLCVPACSQRLSSCSGHSLLMREMFDWAKFPTRMLHDSILSKMLANGHGRSAFTSFFSAVVRLFP